MSLIDSPHDNVPASREKDEIFKIARYENPCISTHNYIKKSDFLKPYQNCNPYILFSQFTSKLLLPPKFMIPKLENDVSDSLHILEV